jgi:hypothetical protein
MTIIRMHLAETSIFVSLKLFELAKRISPTLFDKFLEMFVDMYVDEHTAPIA